VARHARPLVVAMENVPLAWASRRFQRFVRQLAADEYTWTATIANAALYGSCQVRQRLLFVAFRGDLKSEPCFPRPSHGAGRPRVFSYSQQRLRPLSDDPVDMLGISPATQRLAATLPQDFSRALGRDPVPTLRDVIGDLPSIGSAKADALGHAMWPHSSAITARMGRVPEGGRWKGGSDHFSHAYGRLHWRGLARTVTTCFPYAGAGRFWHPVDNRSLSLREAARIQGFPDSFQFLGPDRAAARIVGNALDSCFSSIIYEMVRHAFD
jgi:DNA (cytosine-5)-methyltransferase 1